MRNIIRLDIKQDFVVKGRQFEGYRKVAKIQTILEKIKNQQCEIFLYDVVATLFGINSVINLLPDLLSDTFLPITVGGGIDSLSKVDEAFRLGADRIAINSINFSSTDILAYVAEKYGRQSAVAHVEAKKIDGKWCAMFQNGREIGSHNIENHVKKLQSVGAGELIISSVDNDGMLDGFPLELAALIDNVANVPIIISGGITKYSTQNLYHELKSISGVSISRAFLEGIC
jgi:imidazole glycerol-phosphate synthase subunit HisF